jgi:hypothetical protein
VSGLRDVSKSVRSRYRRRLADTPVSGLPVWLLLQPCAGQEARGDTAKVRRVVIAATERAGARILQLWLT